MKLSHNVLAQFETAAIAAGFFVGQQRMLTFAIFKLSSALLCVLCGRFKIASPAHRIIQIRLPEFIMRLVFRMFGAHVPGAPFGARVMRGKQALDFIRVRGEFGAERAHEFAVWKRFRAAPRADHPRAQMQVALQRRGGAVGFEDFGEPDGAVE